MAGNELSVNSDRFAVELRGYFACVYSTGTQSRAIEGPSQLQLNVRRC